MGKKLPASPSQQTNEVLLASTFFEFRYQHTDLKTSIWIKFNLPFFNTRFLPNTLGFLQENFPGVLTTECFNDQGLPFSTEVLSTELGHLFEHILIRKIYDLRKAKGHTNFSIEGRTEWDWKREEQGIFNININASLENISLFDQALEETVSLFEDLIDTQTNISYGQSPLITHSLHLHLDPN